MPDTAYAPLLNLTRGKIVESVHFGSFVIADNQGRILAAVGDPHLVTFPRSSMKPLQVLSFLEHHGDEIYHFSPKEIAIMCASHSGTDEQVALINGMQAKIGIDVDDLQCGVHWPMDKETSQAMRERNEEPNSLRHNCSGKHTGMLGYARLLGLDLATYLDNQHPVQKAILETVAQMCTLDPRSIPIGTDGCSAPVFGLPLVNFARAFARLCDPSYLDPVRAEACQKVVEAMVAYPQMVAGPGRFDTVLMEVAQGKLIAKAGAEGYQAIGIKPGALFSGSPALGIALKISDGDYRKRAVPFVTIRILQALGALTDVDVEKLSEFADARILNWRKFVVGELLPTFEPLQVNW